MKKVFGKLHGSSSENEFSGRTKPMSSTTVQRPRLQDTTIAQIQGEKHSGERLQKGMQYGKKAEEADQAENFPLAFNLYMASLEILVSEMKKIKDDLMKSVVRDEVLKYMNRSEELKALMDQEPGKYMKNEKAFEEAQQEKQESFIPHEPNDLPDVPSSPEFDHHEGSSPQKKIPSPPLSREPIVVTQENIPDIPEAQENIPDIPEDEEEELDPDLKERKVALALRIQKLEERKKEYQKKREELERRREQIEREFPC